MKIYITRKLPEEIVAPLRKDYEVRMWEKEEIPVPRNVLEKEMEDADGLLCLLTETIDAALMDKAPRLKIIANMAVGFNNIDVHTAMKKGIQVTNTPGVLTETTADLTFALMMAVARRLVEATDYLKDGKWKTWSPMQLTGLDVFGATIGIIGMGRIGEALAKRAKGFGMELLYYNRSRKQQLEQSLGIVYSPMEDLLRRSDFVCIMLPLTEETNNLIDAKELSLMKETAVLINTARGGIVNEKALYEALKNRRIWGAGLDVFVDEPVSENHPLLELPNVMALPHIGSASVATRMKMARLAAKNLKEALEGRTPENLVKLS